jgi:hypothetical protein
MKVAAALEEFFRPAALQASLEKTTVIGHFVSLFVTLKKCIEYVSSRRFWMLGKQQSKGLERFEAT